MNLIKVYRVNVFNNGLGTNIKEFFIRFKAEGKKTFRINAEELLLMIPNQTIYLKCNNVSITLIELDQIEIDDGEKMIYLGFHEVRENVRGQLRKYKRLCKQIEEINRRIAIPELKAYLNLDIGERRGFSLYFHERFPVDSKKRFMNNIGIMFSKYQCMFEKEDVPKQEVSYFRTEFRTGYRSNWESYVYPLEIPYTRQEATYRAKVAICTIYELGVGA